MAARGPASEAAERRARQRARRGSLGAPSAGTRPVRGVAASGQGARSNLLQSLSSSLWQQQQQQGQGQGQGQGEPKSEDQASDAAAAAPPSPLLEGTAQGSGPFRALQFIGGHMVLHPAGASTQPKPGAPSTPLSCAATPTPQPADEGPEGQRTGPSSAQHTSAQDPIPMLPSADACDSGESWERGGWSTGA